MKRQTRFMNPCLLILLAMTSTGRAQAAGGTIEGKVLFAGRPARNALIQMGADPNCLSINAGKKVIQEELVVHRDRGIGNVFVRIVGDVAFSGPPPAEPVTVEQEGCIYHPRVTGAVVGQMLKVRNKDNTLHNVHSMSKAGNDFNAGQPFAGMEFDYKLEKGEVMMRIKCDVHPWMVGYIGVMSHPHFAVTGEGGTFRIEGVPPGSYSLEAWQEKLGTRQQSVEVPEGGTVTVEFLFEPTDTGSLGGSLPIEELTVSGRVRQCPSTRIRTSCRDRPAATVGRMRPRTAPTRPRGEAATGSFAIGWLGPGRP